jgi:drug/metabolite transporter (DMT)-like permease
VANQVSRVGVAWALVTVAIWGMWPVYTRFGLIRSLQPEDLVALRFGVSGLLLLPMLLQAAKTISRAVWFEGVFLATCQGAPFVLLLAAGLVYAPANHAPALTTGLMPLFAAVLMFLFLGRPIERIQSIGLALIIVGIVTLVSLDRAPNNRVIFGDALFVCASVLATIYTLRASYLGLKPIHGAGIVCIYSMVGYLPVYLLLGGAVRLSEAPSHEILFQAFYQGVLMGAVSMITFNKAIECLGGATASAFMSLVPVVATLVAIPVLHETPSLSSVGAIAAISFGVLVITGVISARLPRFE